MSSIAFLLATGLKATIILAVAFLVVIDAPPVGRFGSIFRLDLRAGRRARDSAAFPVSPAVECAVPRGSSRAYARGCLPETILTASSVATATAGPNVFIAWLVPIWLCGAAAVMTRIAVGHLRVRRSLRRADKVNDAEWTALLAEVSAQLGLRRRVDLRRSRETDVPLSYGFLRPLVLLPGESTEWSAERRRVVLLHELIHVKRLDALFCLIAQVSCAAYWFHPLAWLALARFRKEQEQSCDDAVVIAGMKQSVYAEHLVDLARALSAARPILPAALSMADTMQRWSNACKRCSIRAANAGR